MNEYKKNFPELYQYLGGLFHQDWSYVFDWKGQPPDYKGVVRYFKVRNSKSLEKSELKDLKTFLSLNLSEDAIEQVMTREFKIGIRPAFWNLTHKLWLENILQILEEPMEKTKQEFIPKFIG